MEVIRNVDDRYRSRGRQGSFRRGLGRPPTTLQRLATHPRKRLYSDNPTFPPLPFRSSTHATFQYGDARRITQRKYGRIYATHGFENNAGSNDDISKQ